MLVGELFGETQKPSFFFLPALYGSAEALDDSAHDYDYEA
jgi:hypothetical protein